MFSSFDFDKGGFLDKFELGQLLKSFAPKIRDFEIESCF